MLVSYFYEAMVSQMKQVGAMRGGNFFSNNLDEVIQFT